MDEVFKIGTDAMLCGSLANICNNERILEVGTGTGIIALMLAQRNREAKITALEPHHTSFTLAKKNFENAPFYAQIELLEKDLASFQSNMKWDSIVSNPPYFESNSPFHAKHDFARNQRSLDFETLFEFAEKHLSKEGKIQLIFPYRLWKENTDKARIKGLYPERIVKVKGNAQSDYTRVFAEWSRTEKETQISTLILEKSRGKYTEEYQLLTQDFHPHF